MTNSFLLDDLAIRLAADGGEAWTQLNEYPGYKRNQWRDEARAQILRKNPNARFEALPMRWDGREGGCVVRLAS